MLITQLGKQALNNEVFDTFNEEILMSMSEGGKK